MYKYSMVIKLALAALIILSLNACEKKPQKIFTKLADFEGAKIATLNGAAFASFIDPVIPNVEHKYFENYPDIVMALYEDKVDAISLDMPVAKYMVAQNNLITKKDTFIVFPDLVADDRYGFAVAKGSKLGKKANEVLKQLKENGTIQELENIWFSTEENKKKLPKLDYKTDFNGRAGTIRYATESTMVPMSYMDFESKPTGFELDIVSRIAYELNMNVEFISMPFGALLPALVSGKADMVGGAMSITEERLKMVDFVGPHYEGGITLVIKKDRLGKK